MARRMRYFELEARKAELEKRLLLWDLFMYLRLNGKPDASRRVTKRANKAAYRLDWYGAHRSDDGVVLILVRYSKKWDVEGLWSANELRAALHDGTCFAPWRYAADDLLANRPALALDEGAAHAGA